MITTLGDMCKKASSNIAQKDLQGKDGTYPIYGASGLIKYVDFYQQELPYIAVVKDGAGIGRTMLLPAYSSVIGTMQYILPIKYDEVDLEYLYYAITYMNLGKYFSGATIPHIYFKDYKKEQLVLPNIKKQQTIARIFRRVDELINKRREEHKKLDELVKSRFVELFGDIIHNDRRWSECLFSEITSSRLGKMLDAKHQTGRYAFPYLANANVQWFKIETDDLNQMDFNETDQIEFSLKDGDLLVCEGGEIGRCAVWHDQVQPCYFQKALHRVRCNQETILPDYLAWWFKFNCDYNGFAAIEGAKATIAHLTGAKLKKLKVVVPPVELQKIFVDFVKQVDKSKLAVQKSLDELETLKKSLMQQYFG